MIQSVRAFVHMILEGVQNRPDSENHVSDGLTLIFSGKVMSTASVIALILRLYTSVVFFSVRYSCSGEMKKDEAESGPETPFCHKRSF